MLSDLLDSILFHFNSTRRLLFGFLSSRSRGSTSDTGSGDLDGDGGTIGLRNGDSDKATSRSSSRSIFLNGLDVIDDRLTSLASEHDTFEKGGSSETISAVDTTGTLSSGVESRNRSLGRAIENVGLVVDFEAAHSVVHNGSDLSDEEFIVDGPRVSAVEGSGLAPRVGVVPVELVVLFEAGLKRINGDAHVLSDFSAVGELGHDSTAAVVGAVPGDVLGALAVEHQAVWSVVVLPHGASHVVTGSKVIAEPVSISVEDDTTLTTKGTGSEEESPLVRKLWVDNTSRVNLDVVEANSSTANALGDHDSVTSAVLTVGGWEFFVVQVLANLLEERSLLEDSSSITAGSDDDSRSVDGVVLALLAVHTAGDATRVRVGDELVDACAVDELKFVGLLLAEVFVGFNQSVGDLHTRELTARGGSVSTGIRVTTKTRSNVKGKTEALLDPVDSVGAFEGENLAELIPGVVRQISLLDASSGPHGIFVELLGRVRNIVVRLAVGSSTVDSGGCLRGVAAKEGLLIDQGHCAATLEGSVDGGESRETTSDNNHVLRGHRCRL
mmetsp:Transcript_146/g.225  ORF Transcript_146/g.225 Transcript_146/m.225 type:complete len:555 (+) Transcript_146:554-2218(+)